MLLKFIKKRGNKNGCVKFNFSAKVFIKNASLIQLTVVSTELFTFKLL